MASKYSANEQWDALITIFRAAAVPGGKLATINDVQASLEIIPGTLPAIGVQLLSTDLSDESTTGKRARCKFVIAVGTQSDPTTAGAGHDPNLADAMRQLRTFVDDGAGNGVVQVLTTASNFTLNGTVNGKTTITAVNYDWRVQPGPTDSGVVEAYALINLTTESIISSFT